MKPFMDEQFLLHNKTAETLYHEYAAKMPIIDYHCHLSPKEIYENKKFNNLTEVWLYGDHYKWRVLRANGVEEHLVTGNADDYAKFMAWAKTVPYTIGNPLYHWSHLELKRYFGVEELINEKNAPAIWEKVNQELNGPGFGARDLIEKSNVKVVCTTDDPTDSLEYHIKLKKENDFTVKVLPAFRPDKGVEINKATFQPWVGKLAEASGQSISTYDDFLQALKSRAAFFHSVGCSVSDHGLDYIPYGEASKETVAAIFAKALSGESVSLEEEQQYKTHTLIFLGQVYAELGWVMQYHMNASRGNNSRMLEQLGPDTGYDSIGDPQVAMPLCRLFDAMERSSGMPKTILYSLNPRDNIVLASLMGSFQGGGIAGKMQLGSAWWFNDTKDGMLDQMKTLANVGLLSRFVGMLTDSRSFLSYTRHEYFRRILCNLIGEWVEHGEAPNDMDLLGSMVQNISFNNAKEYFSF